MGNVKFTSSDPLESRLFQKAEEKSGLNLKDFAGRKVLIEGGGYEKIWLETQPMGGEMYAMRDMEAALNNQLLFMECRREDGRIPGSIAMIDGKITPQFNKFQGFCFPDPALNMYYLAEQGDDYLDQLYETLRGFDEYLWKVRDSDGDGCLETWCKYDTGEDHAMRYMDAPDGWEEEVPPEGCEAVPIASMDIMSYSYACRTVMGEISRIRGREEDAGKCVKRADKVLDKMKSYLWDEAKGAYYDRDRNHNVMPVLTHNNLRCMYWGSITQEMADRFVKEHLLNPDEFWTKMPLPSVAVNDPLFRNVTTNNWSGQAEALTYQRAIRALEKYGYFTLIPVLGRKLFEAIGEKCVFVQQYDPFTGVPSAVSLEGEQDAYGPAMLSVLEYISRMHGIHVERKEIFWGSFGEAQTEFEQSWRGNTYRIVSSGKKAEAFLNGTKIFEAPAGSRIITDYSGRVLRAEKYDEKADAREVRSF
ncbi:MAG TPA: hypothetical protein H9955_07030 [Candidatus Mediterraneibacter cottocaccae]|nr:hypothetical protein [Candidatus Mediterraneibacter cottocaccae]